jgi:hypothetical protein
LNCLFTLCFNFLYLFFIFFSIFEKLFFKFLCILHYANKSLVFFLFFWSK